MKTRQVVAVLLIVVGLISLLMGGISWTREETVLDLGPIEAKTRERETIPLPPILGGLLLAGGVALLVMKRASLTNQVSHRTYPSYVASGFSRTLY